MFTRRVSTILFTVGILLVAAAVATYWVSAATLRPEPPGKYSELGSMRSCTLYPDHYSCLAEEMGEGTITIIVSVGVLGVVALGLALYARWRTRSS